jgi:C-terminal processing protease CtpA/Prc
MSFNLARVPVLFFFSGLHSDYHRPTDTAEKINAGGAAEVLGLAWAAIDRLARLPERPEYIQVEEPRPISGSGGGYGPYFGSVPDFRDDLGGVLFADVTPGSPADTAGLRSADLLVEFAGKPVGNLYDFTYALQAQVPGDVVTVTVVRDGERVSVEVTLGSR